MTSRSRQAAYSTFQPESSGRQNQLAAQTVGRCIYLLNLHGVRDFIIRLRR